MSHLQPGQHQEELLVVRRVKPAADRNGIFWLELVGGRAVVDNNAFPHVPPHPLLPQATDRRRGRWRGRLRMDANKGRWPGANEDGYKWEEMEG